MKDMQQDISRRKFFKNTLLGTAGLIAVPSMVYARSNAGNLTRNTSILSHGLTPISIIQDSCMLVFSSSELTDAAREALINNLYNKAAGNKGLLAGVLPPGNKKLLDLLSILKNKPDANKYSEKLSIAYGWTGINSAYQFLGNNFENLSMDDSISLMIMMDAELIRQRSLPENNPSQASEQEVENLLNEILTRALTRIHTLKPDYNDGMGWVNRMSEWREQNKKMMTKYAKAIVNPDLSLLPDRFYNSSDPLVKAAYELQKSRKIQDRDIIKATKINNQCLYAQAVIRCFHSINAINSYLNGQISLKEVEKVLF